MMHGQQNIKPCYWTRYTSYTYT